MSADKRGQGQRGPTRLTGLEALFLRMDRGSGYQHTLKIAIVDPSTDPDGWSFDRYRALVEHQLAAVPLMRQRYMPTPFGLHQPLWVDDPDFDLSTHMKRVTCPAPGGMAEFCTLVEQVYCHPLAHDRPLWQVWVVEGLEGGRVALLALIHHAYSDGSGMRAILEEMSSTEPYDPPADGVAWDVAPAPSAARRIQLALRDLPALARAVPPAVRALRDRRRLEREFVARGAADRPTAADRRKKQLFGGRLSRGRRFACAAVSLAEMLEVRAALGGTVNDVFLACVGGSVRAYAEADGRPCREPVVATMPLTLRAPADRPGPGGNFSSADDVWLHPEIADPLERLAATRASAQVTKDHFQSVAGADPFVLVDLIPALLVTAMLHLDERTDGRVTPVSNIVVSNVPGPQDAIYLARWRMDQWFSIGQLWPGATLNFTGWSYDGRFNLCVLADARSVDNAWPLVEGFKSSLAELVTLARAGDRERRPDRELT
jgi:WS/DGAT/MGAT family acyltransferase